MIYFKYLEGDLQYDLQLPYRRLRSLNNCPAGKKSRKERTCNR